ncbi:Acetyltransferase (GNAT) domain-containing protein [Geosporobacter subterraneus DSM 17957]|uniref:Acetyltransferase (GNAT) domain-containing protein n=1 Tax=Geosporobacter subterraneus DSM 17957 TaxID=1121919 RepID=A0A1M6EB57_9FIRM|nr:GNAT family N-acetyltransferase [Geosporobacter subterraneus]SHI82757.1 Acetyltransferase (GNAT) domain-containing protein [Geosporobacter subterraneus DSM 17957]
MTEIKKINKEDTWIIRHRVLWPDRDLDYIKLEDDERGFHYGFFIQDKLVSVISLFIEKDSAQFRKFATLHGEQGKGYGSKLLMYTIEEAKRLGVNRIWCNARIDKADYYKKFGFSTKGDQLEKGGQKYYIMEKTL